jgi:hypothetical protein
VEFTMTRLFLLGAAALTLAGCANSPGWYGGGDIGRRAAGPGLYETPISTDRLRIIHQAPAGLHAAQAEDAALLRAAERTVQSGYDWFVVDQRFTEAPQVTGRSDGPFVSIGGGSSRFGRGWNVSGVGASVGFNLGGMGQRATGPISTLEIRMGRGMKPEGAYDARDIQRTIGARMGAPAYPW